MPIDRAPFQSEIPLFKALEMMGKVVCFPIKDDRAIGVFPLVSMAIREVSGLAEGRSE